MNNFSPNMLKTFDECQWKFFLKYIQKISLPQRAKVFETGKKIHALANYHLKGEDTSKLEKALSVDEKAVWEKLKLSKYFAMETIGAEYNLSCKISNRWVGGRLDALVKDGDNYLILDYKTGQLPKEAEKDFQTIVYLLCADKFLNSKGGYKTLKFVYIGLKNNSEKEILLTEDNKKLYEEKLIKTLKDVDFAVNAKAFTKNADKCKFCEYCKLCK